MGIIGALQNQRGVVGMIPDGNVCFLIARVFDEKGGALFSTIMKAVQWAADEGASVINLSLGGAEYQLTAENYFNDLFKSNVMVISSAGNSGGTEYRWPAS